MVRAGVAGFDVVQLGDSAGSSSRICRCEPRPLVLPTQCHSSPIATSSTVSLVCSQPVVAAEAVAGSPLLIEKAGPIALLKALKNDVELEGFRQAHLRDGVAVVQLFSWYKTRLYDGWHTMPTCADA